MCLVPCPRDFQRPLLFNELSLWVDKIAVVCPSRVLSGELITCMSFAVCLVFVFLFLNGNPTRPDHRPPFVVFGCRVRQVFRSLFPAPPRRLASWTRLCHPSLVCDQPHAAFDSVVSRPCASPTGLCAVHFGLWALSSRIFFLSYSVTFTISPSRS